MSVVLDKTCSMKRCCKCKETKSLDLFYRSNKSNDGHAAICKACDNARFRDQGKVKANKIRCQARKRERLGEAGWREYYLNKYYSHKFSTPKAFKDQLRHDQNNLCDICSKSMDGRSNCHLDHDHSTGRIRAVICGRCNRGLGQFLDDVELLQRAAAYLTHHSVKQALTDPS